MSGGTFDYKQHNITDIIEEIERALKEAYDYNIENPEEEKQLGHSLNVKKILGKGIYHLERAQIYAQRIDYFLAGDDGEENFIKRLKMDLNTLEESKGNRMSEEKELKILRELLWKIGNYAIGHNNEKITDIVSSIRYDYCYNQSNSNVGETLADLEQFRVDALNKLSKI